MWRINGSASAGYDFSDCLILIRQRRRSILGFSNKLITPGKTEDHPRIKPRMHEYCAVHSRIREKFVDGLHEFGVKFAAADFLLFQHTECLPREILAEASFGLTPKACNSFHRRGDRRGGRSCHPVRCNLLFLSGIGDHIVDVDKMVGIER